MEKSTSRNVRLSMRLIEAYLRYYDNPLDMDLSYELLAAIEDYSFEDFLEVQKLRPPIRDGVFFTLTSGGTTGRATPYKFGIHPEFWLSAIERFIKNPLQLRSVHVYMDRPLYNNGRITGRLLDTGGYYYTHTLSLDHESLHLDLNDFDIVCGEPKTFLYLFKDPCFLRFKSLTIASTGYEPFFPRPAGFYINDNMVDWKTGLNFYHCSYGVRHFLPIFAFDDGYAYNLLNLSGERFPADDLFEIGTEVKKCECGRAYLDVRFLPHYKFAVTSKLGHLYELQLADQLEDQYKNLQFIQNGDQVDVLYVNRRHAVMSGTDEEMIVSMFRHHGIEKFKFVKGHYLITSVIYPKLSSFFDNTTVKRPYAEWIVSAPHRIF